MTRSAFCPLRRHSSVQNLRLRGGSGLWHQAHSRLLTAPGCTIKSSGPWLLLGGGGGVLAGGRAGVSATAGPPLIWSGRRSGRIGTVLLTGRADDDRLGLKGESRPGRLEDMPAGSALLGFRFPALVPAAGDLAPARRAVDRGACRAHCPASPPGELIRRTSRSLISSRSTMTSFGPTW